MFALFNNNGRMVRVSEESSGGDVKIELPEDFDFDHIDRYELVDGELVKHDLPELAPEEKPTFVERLQELEEAIELLLSGVTE